MGLSVDYVCVWGPWWSCKAVEERWGWGLCDFRYRVFLGLWSYELWCCGRLWDCEGVHLWGLKVRVCESHKRTPTVTFSSLFCLSLTLSPSLTASSYSSSSFILSHLIHFCPHLFGFLPLVIWFLLLFIYFFLPLSTFGYCFRSQVTSFFSFFVLFTFTVCACSLF